jgi:hypothetical protein
LGDPDTDIRIILKRIFQKKYVRVWTSFNGLRIGSEGEFT